MQIGISNIAWEPVEDGAVAATLTARCIDCIDIAPGKYFPDPGAVSHDAVARVRDAWLAHGIRLHGMQALLFGTSGLNLFGDDGRMFDRLAAVCRLGGRLGIGPLTFGSPRNRDRGGLSDRQAEDEAVRFFRRVADVAADAGVTLCLEPNPAVYNCNFMVTTDETAAIVRAVDRPAIRLQLDVGAIALNGEDPAATIAAHADLIGHVHASEPGLAAMGEADAPHAAAAAALRHHRPDLPVTIEMVATQGPQAPRIARSVEFIQSMYGAVS
ncbi:MAG TPA: TIM barrel protein [Sphingomicrobium sp.]|jgi:sugar phosphate isomerase/epimerase